jgi:hypothetical protein
MMEVIVHRTRSWLSQHHDLKTDSLEKHCIDTSWEVASVCEKLGVDQINYQCSESLSSGLFHCFNVVSFDNLALKQLEVKRLLSEEEWEQFYMGDDGGFTMYIDCVNRQFGRSSTAPLSERYPIIDDIKDMFDKIRK